VIGLLVGWLVATQLAMVGPPCPTVDQAKHWAHEILDSRDYACLDALAWAESRWACGTFAGCAGF
jgi:hypothetical protein